MSYYRVLAACFVATVLLSGVRSQVRQCSCAEQGKCLKDLKVIGESCVDECWSITGQLTQNPQQLRECFRGKNHDIEEFIDCFHDKMEGCVPDKNGPMIPPQTLDAIMKVAEHKIRTTVKSTLDSGLAGNMDQVVAVTEKFANCAKKCILKKTAGGMCMKKYRCQPLMPNEAKVKKLFNSCSRIDFKKQAGPLCQCALNAGVENLSSYCPVLLLMGPQH